MMTFAACTNTLTHQHTHIDTCTPEYTYLHLEAVMMLRYPSRAT